MGFNLFPWKSKKKCQHSSDVAIQTESLVTALCGERITLEKFESLLRRCKRDSIDMSEDPSLPVIYRREGTKVN
jgi:hypothetical protein